MGIELINVWNEQPTRNDTVNFNALAFNIHSIWSPYKRPLFSRDTSRKTFQCQCHVVSV